MSIVLTRRLQGLHALLEMALKDERARPRPDERAVAAMKKKKLAIKDRLAVAGDHRIPATPSRQQGDRRRPGTRSATASRQARAVPADGS